MFALTHNLGHQTPGAEYVTDGICLRHEANHVVYFIRNNAVFREIHVVNINIIALLTETYNRRRLNYVDVNDRKRDPSGLAERKHCASLRVFPGVLLC